MKKSILLLLTLFSTLIIISCDGDDNLELSDTKLVGDEWIDPQFAKVLAERKYIADATTVTPADVAQITKLLIQQGRIESLRGIEYFTSLDTLVCSSNFSITQLDVSHNPKLKYLDCENNAITKLDISANRNLEYLNCNNNDLTTLDVSKCTHLLTLSCYRNKLTHLNVTQNRLLTSLICSNNELTTLILGNNHQLEDLNCSYNQLSQIDVSLNTKLPNK